jgi:predicted nucleic acid-binding Zn ribbon protein
VTSALRARVLREWQPYGDHAAAANRPAAAALDQLIPQVMKGLGLEKRLQESQVFFQWPGIVGTDIARHAQPVALKKGLLFIAVDHPIWLQELSRHHKSTLLQKIQKTIGQQAVRDLVFRIG